MARIRLSCYLHEGLLVINPYEPPKSDIGAGVTGVKSTASKLRWKIFFWIILFLEVLSVISEIIDPEKNLHSIIVEILVYSAILTGLFGFAFSKKIFSQKPWRYLIPIGISWDMFTLTELSDLYAVETQAIFVIILIIVLPISVLQYFALYKYSFKSDDIWT